MNQLLQQLHKNAFTLLVSLPRNEVALAEAALRGGARGLKVHLNVHHAASGTQFGTFEKERDVLTQIAQLAKSHDASVGVVPGGAPFASEAEFAELAKIGIDYFDAYAADAPAWTLTQNHLDKMLAAHHGASMEFVKSLENLGMQICEASILPHEQYGQPLRVLDVAAYQQICQTLETPVIVPTQKKIVPSEMIVLRDAGVKALLIGAVVTGDQADSIEKATAEFAQEIDKL
jgi:hypothetical protein